MLEGVEPAKHVKKRQVDQATRIVPVHNPVNENSMTADKPSTAKRTRGHGKRQAAGVAINTEHAQPAVHTQ